MGLEIKDKYKCFGYIGSLIDIIIENRDIFNSKEIKEIITVLRDGLKLARYDGFTNNECKHIIESIEDLNQKLLDYRKTKDSKFKDQINLLIKYLYIDIKKITCNKIRINDFTSPTYINKQLEEANKNLEDTKIELKKLKDNLALKSDLVEKAKEYKENIEQLNNQKKEIEILVNIKEEWGKKIKEAFSNLQEYIKPIKNERNRLKFLYITYLILTAFCIIFLVFIECKLYYKIDNIHPLPTWEEYFSLILPIPIALGLLWGFITQMNRAQRQLIILSKQIYEIEYIEGLLLTLNILSVDINESRKKINEAIDKLIDNHLKKEIKPLTSEEALKCEIKKDAMPYETIEKVVKIIMDGYKTTK